MFAFLTLSYHGRIKTLEDEFVNEGHPKMECCLDRFYQIQRGNANMRSVITTPADHVLPNELEEDVATLPNEKREYSNMDTIIKKLDLNRMKITIQSPGFKADEKLLAFVTKKLQKLNLFYEAILEGQVCLKADKPEIVENKTCEIKLVIPGNDLFAARNSKIFENAVTKTVNALKSQLLDLKKTRKGLATTT